MDTKLQQRIQDAQERKTARVVAVNLEREFASYIFDHTEGVSVDKSNVIEWVISYLRSEEMRENVYKLLGIPTPEEEQREVELDQIRVDLGWDQQMLPELDEDHIERGEG